MVRKKFKIRERNRSAYDRYLFWVLVAFEILMSFTFLGYVHAPPISVTFAYIPILFAALLLDPIKSTEIGVIFGAASAFKATAYYALEGDRIFSPFLSGNPFGSLILAVGTRALFGFLEGIIFRAIRKKRNEEIWIGAASFFAPILHAALVTCAMRIFFPSLLDEYVKNSYLLLSNVFSAVAGTIVVFIFYKLHKNRMFASIRNAVNHADRIPDGSRKGKQVLIAAFGIFIVVMTFAGAFYFSARTSYMLRMHNVAVSEKIRQDLVHLQIEFTAAMLSLDMISVIALMIGHQYTAYRNFLGEMDAVTGIMGRRIFLNCCERTLKRFDTQGCAHGWFLFLDVDCFKTINDTAGHAVGDIVLREVALSLKELFYDSGLAGRMGGDEFAVMLDKKELSEEELKELLNTFARKISEISAFPQKVTCSIGACRFTFPAEITALMNQTDALLYKTKENGRDGYTIGEYKPNRESE